MGPAAVSQSGMSAEDILQAHPVATLLLSSDMVVLEVNQAAEQLANMGRTAMIGRNLFDLVQLEPTQAERLRTLDHRIYRAHALSITVGQGKDDHIDLQYLPVGDSGERLLTLAPVLGAGEFLTTGSGRSGRSAAAAASMLAHEIKNPLAGIRGAAQLIARQPGADVDRFTNLICAEVDRVAALIDRMQHFSRGQRPECTATNIYPAISQSVESVKAAHGSIRLVEEFDPSIPPALANHDAIVQLLMNLLGNAAEAMQGREDATIRVSTSYRHGLLLEHRDGTGRMAVPIEICVADNGPGVDSDLIDAMFEPFVTTKREGQGLGLALVERLARDMNGAVQYRRKDGWTQFRLHLPAAGHGKEDE